MQYNGGHVGFLSFWEETVERRETEAWDPNPEAGILTLDRLCAPVANTALAQGLKPSHNIHPWLQDF